MKTVLAILGVLALTPLALYALAGIVARGARRQLHRRVGARFLRSEIVAATTVCRCFGRLSVSRDPLRGRGALVLTRQVLAFLGIPETRELAIPLADIRQLALVREHGGEAVFVDLVQVRYTTRAGEDAVAWYVRDAGDWIAGIDHVAAQARRNHEAPAE